MFRFENTKFECEVFEMLNAYAYVGKLGSLASENYLIFYTKRGSSGRAWNVFVLRTGVRLT
jgi:hypothetical protein